MNKTNLKICEILGINPTNTLSINIKIRPNQLPTVFIKKAVRTRDIKIVKGTLEFKEDTP